MPDGSQMPAARLDPLSPEERSRRMARIRGRDTKLELRFRRALWQAGLRGWRCNVRSVTGTPDIAWKGHRVAVFIDSAWWHGPPSRWQPGKLSEWWDNKIHANQLRDARVNQALREQGWTVVRVWDFEVDRELAGCVARVQDALKQSRRLP
jgi:DNA mismatch endonuclease (patch repair protein)